MGKIPRSEASVDFRPAMQPFSTGDGYEAPGRGLQRIGQGIASLGQGIASLQGMVDKDDEFKAKLAMLKLSNEQDLDDMQSRSTFNPDKDDVDGYSTGRLTRFNERANEALSGIQTPRARQMAMLHVERMRGSVGERAQAFQIGQKQQQLYNGAERAITGEFGKLGGFAPVTPSPDAENQAGYAGEGAPAATPAPEEQYMQRYEQTLRAAEMIIQDMPATPDHKQRLAKHVASMAVAALGNRKDAWPAVEKWLETQRAGFEASRSQPQGGGVSSARSGTAVDYLRSKLAPGAEGRVSDIVNLQPVKQDRLAAFVAAAEDAGHDIRILSGHRSAERQAVLWRNALAKYGSADEARKHVAPPGGSTHQSGEAVDLVYMDRGRGLGGKRTAAVEWAHQNAKRFGLHFPLGHEDWHIEPTEAREGGRRYGGSYANAAPMWKPSQGGSGGGTLVGGNIGNTIASAASAKGLDPNVMRSIAHIESSGDPTKTTGSYRGLFQLSEADFRKYGGKGSITDPAENAAAAAAKFADMSQRFQAKNGRAPTPGELYMMHQQGEGGAAAHAANPKAPAWQNMASTAEGREKGEGWAKRAIWGNLTPEAKQRFGSVENVTSEDFTRFWSQRVAGATSPAPASVPVSQRGIVQYAGLKQGTASDASQPPANNDPGGTYIAQGDQPGTRVAGDVTRAPNAIPGGAQIAQAAPLSPVRAELVESLLKAAPAMREAHRRQVEGMVGQIEELALKGRQVDDATIQRAAAEVARTRDPALIRRMELMGPVLAQARQDNTLNEAELTSKIQALEMQANTQGSSPVLETTIKFYKDSLSNLTSELAKNPYQLGVTRGLLPAVPPIAIGDAPDKLRESLEFRLAARAGLMERFGKDLPFLQPQEKQAFIDYVGKASIPPEVRLGTLGVMNEAMGSQMIPLMKEIAKDTPELAILGWLVASKGDASFMKDAVRGMDLARTDGFISRLPSDDLLLSKADVLTGGKGGALSLIPEARQYALSAAKLAYTSRAERAGLDPKGRDKSFDPDIFNQTLQEAFGQTKSADGKTTYGGIAAAGTMFSPYKVFVPPNIRQDGLVDIQRALRTSDFVRPSPAKSAAAAAGREEPGPGRVFDSLPPEEAAKLPVEDATGLSIAPEVGVQGLGTPATADGKPVPIGVIRTAKLVSIGGSRYLLQTGMASNGQPEYIRIRGAENVNFILDFNRIRPIVEGRVPKGTYRPD